MSAATKIIEEMISSEIQKGKFFVFGESAYVELDSVISALPRRNSVKKNCIEVPGFGEIVWPLKNFGNLDSYCFFFRVKILSVVQLFRIKCSIGMGCRRPFWYRYNPNVEKI